MIIPTDEDVLVIDQHTDENDLVQYTRTIGIVKNAVVNNGKLEFEWTATDKNIENLITEAKHPEKLFKYSPEHLPINKNSEYPDGQVGMLKHIAITNKANDGDAVTTRVYDMVKNAIDQFMNKNSNEPTGDKMDEEMKNEVKGMVAEEVKPFTERLETLDKLQESLEKMDFEKLNKIVEQLPELEKVLVKVPDMEKNISKIEDMEKTVKNIQTEKTEEREQLIKNVKTKTGFSETTLENMSTEELGKLDVKFAKNSAGIGEGGEHIGKSIVDQINAEYGTNIGESLNKDKEGEL